MSIIQEALKKAQEDTIISVQKVLMQPREDAQAQSVGRAKPNDARLSPASAKIGRLVGRPKKVAIITVVILLLFAVASLTFFLFRQLLEEKGGVGINASLVAQEVHYRSLSNSYPGEEATGILRPASQKEAVYAARAPRLELNGIMYLEEGPRALVNNSIVQVGDVISGAKVTKINKNSVVLIYSDIEITLNLK
ncbi:MAG: hypothetical protein NC938_01080 [Candidatus Omnitrophica bacterium]|nr:hypothetical protein [Candidatus Omnitrophota bacterium]MCM8790282.1 hypothetical protein [Candidatus Omnitrophota bacterium]